MAQKVTKKDTKKKTVKSKKVASKYFDFYDDIKVDGRDTEW